MTKLLYRHICNVAKKPIFGKELIPKSMSEPNQSSSLTLRGCIQIFIVLAVIGYLVEQVSCSGCSGTRVVVSDFAGTWKAEGQEYNSFSMGGIIEKGNYPVEYSLEVDSEGNYRLHYGSPGFLKLERSGQLKSVESGLIFTSFDLSDSKFDHDVQNIIVTDGHVISFCTRATGSSLEGCHIEFSKP